jgi:hypothetical protein
MESAGYAHSSISLERPTDDLQAPSVAHPVEGLPGQSNLLSVTVEQFGDPE